MSGREGAREAARESLKAATKWPDHERIIQTYVDWCELNSVSAFGPTGPSDAAPTSDQVLLVYLHSCHLERGWSHEYAKNIVGVLGRYVISQGHLDPRGTLVRGWVKAHRREVGSRKLTPTAALLPAEVKAATERDTAVSERVVRQRAVLALADALEDAGLMLNPVSIEGCRVLAGLVIGDFTLTDSQVKVRVAGEVAVIGRERLPVHYDTVAGALVSMTADDVLVSNATSAANQFRSMLRRVAPDLPVTAGRSPRVRTEQAVEWWPSATRAQRLRLMAHVDGHLRARTQDALLRVFSIAGLHRAADMARLSVGHMRPRPDGSGFDYTLTDHKGSEIAEGKGGTGQALAGSVEHDRNGGVCSSVCPACLLEAHLVLRRESSASDVDPLFVSPDGSPAPGQVLGTGGVANTLRRTVVEPVLEDGSVRRVGSRSARVTGATELRRAGASYEEVQAAGGWQDPTTAALYVRRHDPFDSADLALPLDPAGE